MLQKETLLDVVGTSGRHYGVLQSFPVERIEQGNEWRVLSLFATSRLKRHHIVPFGELNGVPVALAAKFGVISKSTDRIFVSYGGLAVLVFLSGDDPIACLNKTTAFMSIVVASRFPSTNNQLRRSSNTKKNKLTIQYGKVTFQTSSRETGSEFCRDGNKGNSYKSRGNNCTKPKRPRNSAWFKEKMLLVQAQESGQVLDEEQLAFLADLGIPDGQA
ncbi:hypothetical protein Tco_0213644 [Tanacetum coccineum]